MINAKRHYGGGRILLKEYTFYDYSLPMKDNNFDGILGVSM